MADKQQDFRKDGSCECEGFMGSGGERPTSLGQGRHHALYQPYKALGGGGRWTKAREVFNVGCSTYPPRYRALGINACSLSDHVLPTLEKLTGRGVTASFGTLRDCHEMLDI